MVRGNKTELAHALGVTRTTLSTWLLRYGAEFPIVERGTNGRDYVFDFDAVFAFLRGKREEEQSANAERDEQLAQLRLPFAVPGLDAPEPRVSPKDELEAWKLRRFQREEAERCGKLVPADAVERIAESTLSRLGGSMRSFIRQLGREHGWSEAYIRATLGRYDEVQRKDVRELQQLYGGGDEERGAEEGVILDLAAGSDLRRIEVKELA